MPVSYDDRFVQLLLELRSNDSIEVLAERIPHHSPGAPVDALFAVTESVLSVSLDESLKRCHLETPEVACHWQTVDPHPRLLGEFSISRLVKAVFDPPPDLAVDSSAEWELELFSQTHIFDDMARGGGRKLGGIRIDRDRKGTVNPEVWFFPGLETPVRMSVDYCGYLDALMVTRGVYGWQYLFADVSLTGHEFQNTVTTLQTMIDVFPEVFPGQDYGDLAARLAERT